MGISHSKAYAAAGVDIEAGYQGVKMMNRYVQRTLTADVISDLGGFGGLFSLDLHGLEKPVLCVNSLIKPQITTSEMKCGK